MSANVPAWLRQAEAHERVRVVLQEVAREMPFQQNAYAPWNSEEHAQECARTEAHVATLARVTGERAGCVLCPRCLHPYNNRLAMVANGCGPQGRCRGSGDFHANGVYCGVDRLFAGTCPVQPGYHTEGK